MSESLQLTIVYEPGEDGWVVASIPMGQCLNTGEWWSLAKLLEH